MKKINKKKAAVLSVLCVLGIAALCCAYYISGVISYQNKVKNTVISEVDISKISDGVYVGEYDVGYISAKVELTVESGEIINIVIVEHHQDRGESAERVVDDIVDEQRIDVDAVTGATNSSVVIKKAVENALTE